MKHLIDRINAAAHIAVRRRQLAYAECVPLATVAGRDLRQKYLYYWQASAERQAKWRRMPARIAARPVT
jgi:hypothetical protein